MGFKNRVLKFIQLKNAKEFLCSIIGIDLSEREIVTYTSRRDLQEFCSFVNVLPGIALWIADS